MRNIIFLRIFELSACWHRRYSAFTAFETAKIAYIARRYRKQTPRSRSPNFFFIYGCTTLDFLPISQFRIINSKFCALYVFELDCRLNFQKFGRPDN